MICKYCGEVLSDSAKTCRHCGASQQRTAPRSVLNPRHTHRADCTDGHSGSPVPVSFPKAIVLFLRNYARFSGRSRRSEYWWALLFSLLVSTLIAAADPELASMWTLAVFVPHLSLNVRRLHDIGKSGWWCLLSLLPVVGNLILIFWFCRDSQPGKNQWGYSPKY